MRKLYSKKYFFIIILLVVGVFSASIILFLIFQVNFNSEQSLRIETEMVNPEEVCIDLIDIGFSSMQECTDFVKEMLTKIKDYSQSMDCEDHQLLFDKLGITCS